MQSSTLTVESMMGKLEKNISDSIKKLTALSKLSNIFDDDI